MPRVTLEIPYNDDPKLISGPVHTDVILRIYDAGKHVGPFGEDETFRREMKEQGYRRDKRGVWYRKLVLVSNGASPRIEGPLHEFQVELFRSWIEGQLGNLEVERALAFDARDRDPRGYGFLDGQCHAFQRLHQGLVQVIEFGREKRR